VQCLPVLKASPRHSLAFRGETLLVSDPTKVLEALKRLQDDATDKLYGVDYEWWAPMERGVSPGKVSLMQICSSERLCVLFSIAQFAYIIPAPLRDFLCDDSITMVSSVRSRVALVLCLC
jgi:hypothetical protein